MTGVQTCALPIWHEVPPADRDSPFIEQANRFIDLMEGKPSRMCSLEAATHTLRFNLAALASAESSARVFCAKVTDWSPFFLP